MALGVMIPETATLKPVVWQRDMEYLRSRLPIVPETASLLAPSIDLTVQSTLKRSSRISSTKRSSVSTSSSNQRSSFIFSRDVASRNSYRSSNFDSRPSPLLDLPVEIRQQILRYLLPCHNGARYYRVFTDCETTIVGPNYNREPALPSSTGTRSSTTRYHHSTNNSSSSPSFHHPRHPRKKKPKHPLAVMRANRQLYAECLGIVYSEKLFHFIGTAYLPVLEFFRRLSPDARAMVRKVRLTLLKPGGGAATAAAHLHQYQAVALASSSSSPEDAGEPDGGGGGGSVGGGGGSSVVLNCGAASGAGGGGLWGSALTSAGLDRLCQEIHDQLPGLEVLKPDPWVWM
ncbi:hypothetical protein EV356DRAFT_532544 [Viridothelium virens]|uniref:Uncharacterized protein n=1 Tax=Viridothelium virens TaxID=1048519 RepID=A0A6A6HB85_VIRVR|nr:hypothetical protein EV356DRAFT_532544 [Viridothelium virens]